MLLIFRVLWSWGKLRVLSLFLISTLQLRRIRTITFHQFIISLSSSSYFPFWVFLTNPFLFDSLIGPTNLIPYVLLSYTSPTVGSRVLCLMPLTTLHICCELSAINSDSRIELRFHAPLAGRLLTWREVHFSVLLLPFFGCKQMDRAKMIIFSAFHEWWVIKRYFWSF